jgi:hypothetical protein
MLSEKATRNEEISTSLELQSGEVRMEVMDGIVMENTVRFFIRLE